MSHVRYIDFTRKITHDRSGASGGKRLAIAIAHGMATTGMLYNLPPLTPMKYEREPNADLISIGNDMWRAVEIYKDEQIRQQT